MTARTDRRPRPAAGPDAAAARASSDLTLDDRAALLRYMLLMRRIEERGLALYRQGKVPGSFFDGAGQEAIPAGTAFALAPRDRLCITCRDLAAHLIRGVAPRRVFAQLMGLADGVTAGKDGNVHFADPSLGCVSMVSMLPDMMPVACGLALAAKTRGEDRVALTYHGDGSTSNGTWHEAVNFAAVLELPVVFVLENNQFAYSTPNERQFRVDPLRRADAYGIAGAAVDGNDVEAVFAVTREAVERARTGGGPTLIVAETMRMHGHGAHDDMSYVPAELLERWAARDPIARQSERLRALDVDVDAIAHDVDRFVEAELAAALESPMPEPETAFAGVFATADPGRLGDGNAPWSRYGGTVMGRA